MGSDTKLIGDERQRLALLMTARFGYLRPMDMMLYTNNISKKSEQQWMRTFAQLADKGLVQKRNNALGTTTYVLRAAGARAVRDQGIYDHALSGNRLSITGATSFHRELSNMGMLSLVGALEREHGTKLEYATEYEMQRSLAPINYCGLLTSESYKDLRLQYAPDGLIMIDGQCMWLETESTQRTLYKLKEKLRWLAKGFNKSGHLLTKKGHETLKLGAVIFIIPVGPGYYDHEKRLRKEIAKLPRGSNIQYWKFLQLPVSRRLRPSTPTLFHENREQKVEVNLITGEPQIVS